MKLKLLGSTFLIGLAFTSTVPAADFVCQPTEVAVYQGRLHVRCSQTVNDGGNVIRFWAVSTANAQHANRFLTVAASALVSGRNLKMSYTPGDTSGSAFGCLASDCRVPWAVTLS